MYGGDFDGAAAFSGGGFMPSQATQTTEHSPSISNKNQTLMPLTVNQINKALQSSDDKVNFLIDGVDVNNVKLVGMVLNKFERVTDVSFVLDDYTGRIDCNRWVQEAVDTKEIEAIMEGMYVRIHGQLKTFQGKKRLTVFGIKPVTDFDEITHHFVECIYVHSYNVKLMKVHGSSSINQSHLPNSAALNTQSYQTAPSHKISAQHVADELQGPVKKVIDYLQLPGSLARESGVHQEEIATQLGIPLDKIIETLNWMHGESWVYPTIDDYHWKTTINA